ncbi:hypothetical protein [Mangrovimonas spongiae]|uniref:hypothetical protein n=1 Tax=Mangrovimonas spongiae TaxID=2494697 RepID=UPI001315153D|nr:hypothetical protein [Mangrovimonas spongiae]
MRKQFCKVGKTTPNPTKNKTTKDTKAFSENFPESAYAISKTVSFNDNCIAKPIL